MTVAEFSGSLQICLTLRFLDLLVDLVNLLTDTAYLLNRTRLRLPTDGQLRAFLFEVGELFLNFF